MKLKLWAATVGALLAAPVCALAQQAPRAADPADPADPRAAVTPAVYESAMPGPPHRAPEKGDATPDKRWRSANDTVAGAPAHAGHGNNAAPASGHAHEAQALPAAAAKPAGQAATDHGKHH